MMLLIKYLVEQPFQIKEIRLFDKAKLLFEKLINSRYKS